MRWTTAVKNELWKKQYTYDVISLYNNRKTKEEGVSYVSTTGEGGGRRTQQNINNYTRTAAFWSEKWKTGKEVGLSKIKYIVIETG